MEGKKKNDKKEVLRSFEGVGVRSCVLYLNAVLAQF